MALFNITIKYIDFNYLGRFRKLLFEVHCCVARGLIPTLHFPSTNEKVNPETTYWAVPGK